MNVVLAFERQGLGWDTMGEVFAGLAVVGVILAERDQRTLIARGYRHRTSPLFAAVNAVYLFIRGNRCFSARAEGLGPAWLHLAFTAAALFSPVLLPWIEGIIDIHDLGN